ncbi:glycerol kinase GlpK [Tepidimonas charontis]|uniref:Glycerol kinase n=1 Tax=Tepidimonas charontis TaxID=2267262 RepID=A0A554XET5_9BURK|nr:glycerol kinase GlpK [Tepidimonas charontis]TSE34358.1 Glycerol kinase [Tepidimonas charontis]
MSYLLALDQGTSSSRSIVFDRDGHIVAMAQREFRQLYPQPGWVEHDPRELWDSQRATAQQVLARLGAEARAIAALGITNQRETTVVWERASGAPIYNAIVWQDRRTEPICAALRAAGWEPLVQDKTGLRLDPYFSGTKLKWILDHVPHARSRAQRGELAFGTVDSWLIWQLTGGRVHATDVSNAARTLLFNVRDNRWDEELLRVLDIPAELLPAVYPSSHPYGEVAAGVLGEYGPRGLPIAGVAGDQQAALFGQACFRPGLAKNTYGTGCFMLMHTGARFQPSDNGLLTTSAAQPSTERAYALEGSVFVGGAVVQWLRDGLRAIATSAEVESLAASVPDAAGVMFVPAFTGLGAPYWQPQARGAIVGLTRGTTVAHIARAAVESIAFQSAALLQAMSRDAEAGGAGPVAELRVDGGASANNLLMQFQADLLGIPVVRPQVIETTALGVAYLAGLQSGVYRSLDEIAALWRQERRFWPTLPRSQAEALMARWEHAVRQATAP